MGECTSSYNCSGCQSGCNNCNGCVRCEGAEDTCSATICNTCNNCVHCQSICELSGQNVGTFDFGECIASNEVFISADSWKNLIIYIQKAYGKGTKKNYTKDLNLSEDNLNVQPGDYMKADMYKNIASALNGLGGSSDGSSISIDGIEPKEYIYGSYFDNIETYSAKWLLKAGQCNWCNAGCDTCDSCEAACDSCNNCNDCEATCEDCIGCNSCEGCLGSCETTCESSCQTGCEVSCQTGCEVSCQSDNPEG